MPDIERILLIRDDAIGDAVLFSGSLSHIRRKWPDARIDLLAGQAALELFSLCPHIDHVLTSDRLFPWRWAQRKRWSGAWRFERALNNGLLCRYLLPRYDLLICPVSAPTEATLQAVRRIRAREKWGFGGYMFRCKAVSKSENRSERVFTRLFENLESEQWEHEFRRLKGLLRECGVDDDDVWPRFWVSADDMVASERMVPLGDNLAICHGAGSSFRQWPVENWIQLSSSEQHAERIILFGGGEDRLQGERIAAGMRREGREVIDLTGKTNLRQLAGCLSRCSWIVSNETAALHIAVALDLPTVGLMGGHHFGRYYPWGDSSINRAASVSCEFWRCNCECRFDDFRCVRDIPVDVVLHQLEEVVSHAQEGCVDQGSGKALRVV